MSPNPVTPANLLRRHAGCGAPPLPVHPSRPLVGRRVSNRYAGKKSFPKTKLEPNPAMRKFHVVSFAALAALSMPLVSAAELLDAPGPGYHQQRERLSPSRHQLVVPKLSPSIEIYPANGAFSMESLSKMEQAFSEANRLIQSASWSSKAEVSGTVKQQPRASVPERAK